MCQHQQATYGLYLAEIEGLRHHQTRLNGVVKNIIIILDFLRRPRQRTSVNRCLGVYCYENILHQAVLQLYMV